MAKATGFRDSNPRSNEGTEIENYRQNRLGKQVGSSITFFPMKQLLKSKLLHEYRQNNLIQNY